MEKTKAFFIALIMAIMLPCTVAAANYSVKYKNTPVEQVLADLQKVTGYDMVYQKQIIDPSIRVTCQCSDANLDRLLNTVVRNNCRLDYELVDKTVVLRKPQPRKGNIGVVSGQITDTTGEPLAGVSVKSQSSGMGVNTDLDGKFSIRIDSAADNLDLSYVGMRPQTVVLDYYDGLPLHLTMENDERMMDEVVVTGYQTINKEKLTGSITVVNSEALGERYTPNLLDNLEGRVAGLSTYGGNMIIRGTGTLYGSTEPLLVVDGLPIEGSISDLNPYDIESVNVLKDAAASAIYGARAANGIIVVTTKNAKKKGKVDIDFSANLTVYENRNMDYAANFYMTPAQQVAAESEYYDYYYLSGAITDAASAFLSTINQGTAAVSPLEYAYYQRASGQISDSELSAIKQQLSNNNYARDYANAVYRQQVLQQYNLAIRTSGEKSTQNIVLNYKYDNQGQIYTYSDWLNVSYKGSFDLAKWLTANVSINGIHANSREPGTDYNGYYSSPWSYAGYWSFYNADGSIKNNYGWYDGNEYFTFPDGTLETGSNPIDEFRNNTQRTTRQNLRYHGDLLFKIIPGLTANAQFIYEVENIETRWSASGKSHAARTLRNAYTTYSSGSVTYLVPKSGGFLQTTNTTGRHWTARGQANYSRTFNKVHDIAAIVGLEFRQTKYNGTKSLALGYDEQLQSSATQTVDLGSLADMRYTTYFMSSGFPAYQFAYSPYIESGIGIVVEQLHRYASGYGNVTYTYDDRYNIFGSYRKDYADVYGLNSKFRGKPLWSAGAGWNIHREDFMREFTWLSFAKIRTSYGVTGNIYQGATSYMVASSTELNYYTNQQMGVVESPANPNLRWEQSRTTNIGLDYGFLDYRLRGSIDFYNKVSKDVFNNTTIDPTTGFSSMFANVASMRNRGIELAIAFDWFRASDPTGFSWTTSATVTHNKNIVTDVENPATKAYELISTPYVTGYPASALWSYQFAGISDLAGYEGMTMWYTADGGTSHTASTSGVEALVYSGQTDPKIMVGLDNTWKWNNFSLGCLMAYYGGHKMRALCENETFGVGSGSPLASYFLNAWTPENPTSTPGIGQYSSSSLGTETRYSDISVRPADFIKIRNIVFGYDIPINILHHLGVNSCTLRFQINNPKALWTKNDLGVDPETLGIRSLSSYVFGLNINL